jgi:hypothetical protein
MYVMRFTRLSMRIFDRLAKYGGTTAVSVVPYHCKRTPLLLVMSCFLLLATGGYCRGGTDTTGRRR